jgi:hypothetical protein
MGERNYSFEYKTEATTTERSINVEHSRAVVKSDLTEPGHARIAQLLNGRGWNGGMARAEFWA